MREENGLDIENKEYKGLHGEEKPVEKKQKVLITIKGIQGELADAESIEMTTTGTLYDKKGTIYLNYVDTYIDDEIETKTTIKMTKDKVTVIRFGAASTNMIFEKNKEHIVAYDTKFGVFEINTATKKIELNRTENTLDLKVLYVLEVNHQSMGLSKFELSLKYINN